MPRFPLPLAALALLASAAAASPPPLSEFKLEPKPGPRVDPDLQGPGLKPAPTPLPRERPAASPPAPTPPAEARPDPAPQRPAPAPAARPSPVPATRSRPIVAEPAEAPGSSVATPVESPTTDVPLVEARPVGPPVVDEGREPVPVPDDAVRPDGRGSVWPFVVFGLAGLIVLLALGLALRRRRAAEPTVRRSHPREDQAAEPLSEEPAPIAVQPAAPPPPAPAPLTLAFHPLEARATALGSSLKARITVTAGATPVAGLSLDLLMAGAGEAGDAELARFAADGSGQPRVDLPDLAAGESHAVERSLRVGARDFRPIQLADRAIFVPLVGLDLTGAVAGEPVRVTAAHVVGRSPKAGGKMGPFRVDQGPRHYLELDGRPHALAG